MSKVKTKNNTLFLPKEKIWVNPKIFRHLTGEDIYNDIPWEKVKEKNFRSIYGSLNKMSYTDPVENTIWDFGYFLDSSIFSPAAIAFGKSKESNKGTKIKPAYCPHIEGTTPYKDFYKNEMKRILYGYEPIVDGEPCGIRISGEFYFYLNYCHIKKVWVDKVTGVQHDESTFPTFLSMDYYYFKELEARENPKAYGLPDTYKGSFVLAKSRRKGFSYKAAAGAVWVTAFKRGAKVLIASDTGYDATLCFKKCMPIIDWLTDYTPFGREELGDTKTNGGWKHIPVSNTSEHGHFVFGYENTKTKKRKGRLSEIMTVSLAISPDKASGEGVQRIYFEEAGKISNLKKAWTFARESLKAGALWRGIAIIFGTGGSMVKDSGEKGSSRDFSELFHNPVTEELAAFKNIYEYAHTDKYCGWFVSDMWSNFGATINVEGETLYAIDDNGNGIFWVAEFALNKARAIKKEGKKEDYDLYLTQRCKTPEEAFLVTEGTVFPTADLLARKSDIEMSRLGYEAYRIAGTMVEYEGLVSFKPDLEGKLQPIDSYVVDSLDREGCVLKYESPIKIDGHIPEGAYIISVDPIGQNTVAGKSMTSIIVMKTPKYAHKMGPEKIVATYRGRSKINPQGFVHELLMKLSKYYNAKITYENDRDGGILQYFIRKGEVARLLPKPEMTLNKYLKGSATALREYGHSMGSSRHKQIGEDLLLEWLMKRHPNRRGINKDGEEEVRNGLRNLDLLEDKAILEELIAYTRSGNFDTTMALMGAVIQVNEYFNEDFIKEKDEGLGNISSFWKELYIENYGSPRAKAEYAIKKQNTQNPRIEW